MNYDLIPEKMMRSMKEYVDVGCPMGDFLTAVFANDLQRAFAKADDYNVKIIKEYVMWVWWESPANCNGSHKIVQDWRIKKRYESHQLNLMEKKQEEGNV